MKVYDATNDVDEFKENLELFMDINRELIKDYRICQVLEKYNMDKEDIDKVLMIMEAEELNGIDQMVKDTVDMYWAIEDEGELINTLKGSGAFPSLK